MLPGIFFLIKNRPKSNNEKNDNKEHVADITDDNPALAHRARLDEAVVLRHPDDQVDHDNEHFAEHPDYRRNGIAEKLRHGL